MAVFARFSCQDRKRCLTRGAFLGPLARGHLWDIDIRYPWYASAGVLTAAALTAVCCIGAEERGGRGGDGELLVGEGVKV